MPSLLRLSLLSELVLVDGGGSLIVTLVHGAAYHTSLAMNQHIVSGTQNCARHTQGKMDLQPCLDRTLKFKDNPAGGDISRQGGDIAGIGR